VFGECADQFTRPTSDQDLTGAIDTSGIIALSSLGTFALGILIMVFVGLLDKRKRKCQPVPEELPGMMISFKDVSYVLKGRPIISGISGEVKPGEVLAVLGPSGSGKSTFLDILAQKRKGGVVTGDIKVNGLDWIEPAIFRKLSGYVDQDDYHISTLTVREVLEFSADLRLPEGMSVKQKSERIDMVLDQLGLTAVQNSRVGSQSKRGISGGEKRRLSIGVELVTNPSILFLDEPTSGLDSYNALQVVQTLSKLAVESDKTVIVFDPRLFLPFINRTLVFSLFSTKSCCYHTGSYPISDQHMNRNHFVHKKAFLVQINTILRIIC
jgi:energy-coupling factor transporter ATP-binding protein EcfA2